MAYRVKRVISARMVRKALTNKNVRAAWALLTRAEPYQVAAAI